MRGTAIIFGLIALGNATRNAFLLGVELGDEWINLNISEFLIANTWVIVGLGVGSTILLIAGQNEFEGDNH